MAIHYNSNHGGRDSYIYGDNGGFSIQGFGSHEENYPGTMRQGKSYRAPDPSKKYSPVRSKPIHYHNNGTGRDSYIAMTNGGFMSPPMVNSG